MIITGCLFGVGLILACNESDEWWLNGIGLALFAYAGYRLAKWSAKEDWREE